MGKFLRVLFIEDTESDVELVVHVLTKAGYDIDFQRVETRAEMSLALDSEKWDIVLSDYELPGFNGQEALAEFKSRGLNIPFIVVSGAVGEDTAATMMKLGAHDYVMKEKLTRLVLAIEREMQEAKLRSERIEVERALAFERYLLHTLMESLPDKLYFKDKNSRFTRVNKAMAGFFGLSDPAQAIGKTDFDFFLQEHARLAFQTEREIIASGRAVINLEEKETWPDGHVSWVNSTKMPMLDVNGEVIGVFGISSDITERKRTEMLIQARMDLLEYASGHALGEILQKTLDLVEELTGSLIGFYHFVDADQTSITLQAWSTRTMREFCEAQGKGLHYNLDQAGVWVDAARQGEPVIHNNYAALPNKRGMPEGHASVTRELVVPIFRKGKIVAILGVGNKAQDYTEQDKETVNYLADIAWEMVVRKRSEEAIQESQSFLQNTIDALDLNLCVLDKAGTITMVNQAWRQFADANPPVPPGYCVGMNYLDVCDRASGESVEEARAFACGLRAVMCGQTGSFVFEYACHSPLGAQRYYFARVTRFDWKGVPYTVISHTDITEQKLTQEKFKENEKRYRTLYENISVGLFRTSLGGQIVMANPALVRMLGFSSFEELAKHNIAEVAYDESYSRADFLRIIHQSGQIKGMEVTIKRQDGKVVTLREYINVVRNAAGEVDYFEGTIEDITDFHQSELQNQRLAAAIENAGETVILADPAGVIQYANPAFEGIFGLPAHEYIGKNVLDFSSAGQSQQDWQEILRVLQDGKVWRGDMRATHASGNVLDIETTISPTLDLYAKVSSLVFVMRNVTQQRKAESQARQSQKLEAIGQLAAGIAHEINTPTQFIGNNVRFLQKACKNLIEMLDQISQIVQCSTNETDLVKCRETVFHLTQECDLDFLKAEIPPAIDGALKGIDRVSKIVNAMKEFSHPGTHDKVITDINHAIENTVIVSRNEWKYIAELTTDLDPDLPQVPCLVDEFNQVILNLITNAADAIRETLLAEPAREKGNIKITTGHDAAWVIISIADDGNGIPETIRDRIFDPFFTTKEVGKGTGQGLSISYDVIVNKHAGKISFETETGKGTTFYIHLPIESLEKT